MLHRVVGSEKKLDLCFLDGITYIEMDRVHEIGFLGMWSQLKNGFKAS